MSLKQGGKADIVDVARRARVSISTVSRSFNHPDLVNPATRKKIERAVQALGYIRNRAAQTMHGRRSGTIGLIVPTIDNAIFAEVIQSFSDAVDHAGFTLLIASHGFDLDREYAVLRKFLEHRVDGVALIGLDHSEPTFQLLDQQAVPVISIWNYEADSRISCVGPKTTTLGGWLLSIWWSWDIGALLWCFQLLLGMIEHEDDWGGQWRCCRTKVHCPPRNGLSNRPTILQRPRKLAGPCSICPSVRRRCFVAMMSSLRG